MVYRSSMRDAGKATRLDPQSMDVFGLIILIY